MESLSFEIVEVIEETLRNIRDSICLLQEWNRDLRGADEWTTSPTGMQKLAANCMLIEAIGEAVKKIEKRAGLEFLNQRPEIPWRDIMNMRNHIAHGYFELDDAYVYSVIKNDLSPLLDAIDFLLKQATILKESIEIDERIETEQH